MSAKMPTTDIATMETVKGKEKAKQPKSFVDSMIFRIDNQYYDLSNFCDEHPGGKEILIWAKRKAWDHTQVFAIHHVNYVKASAMMKKFLISDKDVIERIEELIAIEVPKRFPKQLPKFDSKYYPKHLDKSEKNDPITSYKPFKEEASKWSFADLKMADCTFELPNKGSFYWELREEIFKYFKKNNISYYPTPFYMQMFWFVAFLSLFSQCMQYYAKSYLLAVFTGLCHLVLGGYGHQFIHNPVMFRKYAYLCLDWMGLWSYTYMVDHVYVHHIYTNTIPDNHFEGTDPFVYVNPFVPRAAWRKMFNFILANVTVSFGIFGNYLNNVSLIIAGKEPFNAGIFLFPANYALTCWLVGDIVLGCKLCLTSTVLASWWYFTIALMNHNQEGNWDMDKLTKAAKTNANNGGWAEMQLVTSTDIGYNYGFIGSMLCLWLNYHTVHHLLPTVDMSHHREAQRILERVSAKHGVAYQYNDAWTMYFDMLTTFSVARALDVMMEKE